MPNATRDYGDLRVTMTSEWDWKYNDLGTGAARAIDVYHAKSQGDLRPLGSFAASSYLNGLTGKRGTLLVCNNPNAKGTPAVASPTGYDLIWNDKAGGGRYDGSFWRSKAPSRYVSVGDLCTSSYTTPSNNLICIWDDRKSGAKLFCSVWAVARPIIGASGSEKLSVLNDTFRLGPGDHYAMPAVSLAKVLALPNPKDFTEFDSKVPEFTKDKLPRGGDTFGVTPQAEVILPYTAFFPASDRPSLNLISNPFILLSKRTAWSVYATHTNNSGGTISNSTTVKKGVSRTESTEMSHTAGVEISASYGIMGFGRGLSLNYQFTAKTSSSYNEYMESSRMQGFTVPPFHATVFLTRYVWIRSRRSDGSSDLHELGFNANEDIILVGVDLK